MRYVDHVLTGLLVVLVSACGQTSTDTQVDDATPDPPATVSPARSSQPNPLKNVYWGDTHLHTSYSPDAFLMQNRSADPDTAYRFASGLPVVHPYHRARVQIGTPLDFLAVTDHAEFMGVMPKIFQGDPLVTGTPTGARFQEMAAEGREIEIFGELIAQINQVVPPNPDLVSEEITRTVWGEIMDAADRYNEPGTFTTIMGWEWSSTPGGANLHRVVLMREGRQTGEQFIPYNSFDSDRPEDLWRWLDETNRMTGATFLAIPHNSNISQGLMFPVQDSDGNPLTAAYAESRMRWEPIVEVTQIKGDSETHPNLSPTDEFSDFERYGHLIAVEGAESQYAFSDAFLGSLSDSDRQLIESQPERAAQVGDYIRSGLLRGLVIEDRIGANPYKFGLIGSTDAHTGFSSAEEDNFHGKMALDSTPETKSEEIIPGTPGWDMGAAGLVGVWAEENTRESLFDAMQSKEVYASTGPRISVRFFGGWDFTESDLSGSNVAEVGYARGVPMGGAISVCHPMVGHPAFLSLR